MSAAYDLIAGPEGLGLLADVALKATLVLLLAAAAIGLMRRSSAALRHLVWCVGVLGVLALPLLALVLPTWEMQVLPSSPGSTAPLAVAELAVAPDPGRHPGVSMEPSVASGAVVAAPSGAAFPSVGLPALAATLALAGLLVGLLWFVAGLWGATRIGRRAEAIRDPEWLSTVQEISDQLGLRRPVRVLRSRGADMPATWGLLWPSVILPAEADRWPEERLRTVLAHELAHVKRFDCLTQAGAQLACVLLWWHPLVWYAARRLRVERERACDDLVLQIGARPSAYATQLLEIARTHRTHRLAAALVSMARPSQLESRLLWILDGSRSRSGPSRHAALLAVLLGFAVVAPLAAMKPVEVGQAQGPQAGRIPMVEGAVARPPAGAPGQRPPRDHAAAPASRAYESAVGSAAAAADTPQVRQRRGPSEGDRAVDDLIRMRIHGVSPAFVREIEQVGYSGLSVDQLVKMRIHGVSPVFVREMEQVGYSGVSVDQLVKMRIHGVSPAFVRELREAGIEDLSIDTLVRLRISGVDRDLIESGRRGRGRTPQ
jgi:beta-lactamase regulating signal transducer with metallopeptidase domain